MERRLISVGYIVGSISAHIRNLFGIDVCIDLGIDFLTDVGLHFGTLDGAKWSP